MDAREELEALLNDDDFWDKDEMVDCFMPSLAAPAILAAGYRKMPDREAIATALHKYQCNCAAWYSGDPEEAEYDEQADAILALMDGNK